jgi:hypothetical protein
MKTRKTPDKTRQKTIRSETTRLTAARAAGVSLRTLERMIDPAFRLELEQARRAAFEDALGGLKGASSRAVEALSALLRSKKDSTRRLAASEILSAAFRSYETGELESRIATLEKKAAEISNREGAVN